MIKLKFIIRFPLINNIEIWHNGPIYEEFIASFHYNKFVELIADSFPKKYVKFKNRLFKHA